MIIQHNLTAMNNNRSLKTVSRRKSKTSEKLSSGYRVNRAADDAAALSISEKMRIQIRGLNQAVRNIQDGISYVQIADGALGEIHDMLHRMNELSVQASNDTNTASDRKALNEELQQLKEEIDHIFENTEFNTKKIWDTNAKGRVQIGTKKKQALSFSTGTQRITLTETNKDAIAYDNYTIKVQGTDPADTANYGFTVTWKGYNGNQYSTDLISWPAEGSTNFSVNLADHLDTTANPELTGINYKIGWNMEEASTVADMARAIDGSIFSSDTSSSESILLNNTANGVSLSISTSHLAELASERNVEQYDTDWIQPLVTNGTNVITQPSYNSVTEDTGWAIQFTMKNIGSVTATSTSVHYYSHDTSSGAEGKWWRWDQDRKYKYTILHTPDVGSDGTLHGVTDAITDSGNNKDSLIKNANGSGVISVYFDLKPDSGSFSYKGRSSTSIGSMTMSISVSQNDTEETIMEKVKSALNTTSIVDAYEGNSAKNTPYPTYSTMWNTTANRAEIDVPVYKATIDLKIQSGANPFQPISITYESLRTNNLGISDTNILTYDSAQKAIDEISNAVKIVSEQRSLFGAYQNRMEHAAAANENTAENQQAAESRLRDADMADLMVEYSRDSILEQFSQAMLSSANQDLQQVLTLLA